MAKAEQSIRSEPADAEGLLATLAGDREACPSEWTQRFATLFQRGVSLPAMTMIRSGVAVTDALADRYGVKLEFNPHPSVAVQRLISRVLSYLVAGKQVAIDISEAWPEAALMHTSDCDPVSVSEIPGRVRQMLTARGVTRSPDCWILRGNHPDLMPFLATHRTARAHTPVVAIVVTDTMMATIRDGGRISLTHRARPGNRSRDRIRSVTGNQDWRYSRPDAVGLWQRLIDTAHRYANVRIVIKENRSNSTRLFDTGAADVILPGSLHMAPVECAHLAAELDLSQAAGHSLCRTVQDTVRFADNLLESIHWPTTDIARDAVEFRRLFLYLSGIGDFVRQRRLDPLAFSTLTCTRHLIKTVRASAIEASRLLAADRGPCMAYQNQFCWRRGMAAERVRTEMRRHALRNSCQVILSPFSVLPVTSGSRARCYANLLPVLAAADILGFARPPVPLSRFDLEHYLRRAWAYRRARPGAVVQG